MMNRPNMSPAEFYALLYPPLVRLQAAHVYDRVSREGADLAFAFTHWTMLRALLNAEPGGPGQGSVMATLCSLYERHREHGNSKTFAGAVADFLAPIMREYLEGLPQDRSADHPWFGCFGYTVDRNRRCVALHFYNAVCPQSPFANPHALRDDLRQCVLAAAADVPDAETARCGSWINNLPPFLALFPQTYVDSLVETDPDGKSGLGWWGQFLTSRGRINRARAERLLTTGEFTYARKLGRCAFGDLLAHVATTR